MLFVLSDELLQTCSATSGADIEGLQNLLLSVRRGHHALVAKHAILSALASNNALSDRERGIALRLANRSSELGALASVVTRKVIVTSGLNQSPNALSGGSWKINASDLTSRFFGRTKFLAENLIDAQLYLMAAEQHRVSRRYAGVMVCGEPRGGGGSQIDVELSNELSNGNPVAAITDGDCRFPGQPHSAVSRRCDAAVSAGLGVGWHQRLNVLEIENLIPAEVYVEATQTNERTSAKNQLDQLSNLASVLKCNPSHYVCHKSGLKLSEVFLSGSSATKAFWLDVARRTGKHSVEGCLQEGQCQRTPCKCSIATGFGEGCLSAVRTWMESRGSHEVLRYMRKSEDWMSTGEFAFEATIAFRPEIV